jgi:hypothetical protein
MRLDDDDDDDDDDSDDGVRASARTPLPAAGSRCLVDEYRPRWTDGRTFARRFEAPRVQGRIGSCRP